MAGLPCLPASFVMFLTVVTVQRHVGCVPVCGAAKDELVYGLPSLRAK
jgi:hypothetical protein